MTPEERKAFKARVQQSFDKEWTKHLNAPGVEASNNFLGPELMLAFETCARKWFLAHAELTEPVIRAARELIRGWDEQGLLPKNFNTIRDALSEAGLGEEGG